MYNFAVVKASFNSAWDEVWALVQKEPKILLCRETQIHFELTHRFLDRLKVAGCIPWTDCEVYVDTPDGIPISGVADFSVIMRDFRPDILVLPKAGAQIVHSGTGLAAELKIIEDRLRTAYDDLGEPSTYRHSTGVKAAQLDVNRLQAMANSWGQDTFRGVMCLWHYHRLTGDAERCAKEFVWESAGKIDGVTIRRSLKWLDGFDVMAAIRGVGSEQASGNRTSSDDEPSAPQNTRPSC